MKLTKPILNRLAKNLRVKQTDAEKILWKHLRSRQIENTKFRRQQPIGNYIVDFISLDKKLIIELDGGQHSIYSDKDQRRDKWLTAQGFKVLRFWNNDVMKNTEGVLESIMKNISPSPSPSPHTLKGTRGRGNSLRMLAWEVTRSCNLNCRHCRAAAGRGPYKNELSTQKCFQLLDEIAAEAAPVIILTGGEPLLRADIFDIAGYGTKKGLRVVMATNGTLVDSSTARKMIQSGIKRVSISLDGKDAQSHDSFRGEKGAFAGALAGIEALKSAGMEFQINTTVTTANLNQIREILDLAIGLGAAAHHIFLLVPTGRGREMADQAITASDYEETLMWFHRESQNCSIQLKATCAPHYFRIMHQQKSNIKEESATREEINAKLDSTGYRGGEEEATQSYSTIRRGADDEANKGSRMKTAWHSAMTRGCLGGSAFCFISHTGQVQPCGYLELDCGNIQKQSFAQIWESSEVFQNLRDLTKYSGKCGRCEFIKVCGGCRARAYEATGDYLAEETLCLYEPRR